MKFTNLSVIIWTLIIFIVVCLIGSFFYISTIDNFSSSHPVEIIVSRYNEDLKWLLDTPFDKYPVIIYNKGDNDDFEKPPNVVDVIKLPNVGRESHTYLHHVIENYNKLADVTIFLPGSIEIEKKMVKVDKLFEALDENENTSSIFVGKSLYDLKLEAYSFTLDEWMSTNDANGTVNPEKQIKPADIRPFGKWYDHFFDGIRNIITTGFGIFAISKQDIKQHTIEYYRRLINELEGSSNPETGHFFERAWYAVFYPYNNVKLIEHPW